ncbi:hypothetical protein AB0C96_12850 [Streptomyces sp. NPDC048506]|uniref:hypothetical protein n=1 Tax=Streptomyces sp. NPDC048506 TaxID=3155028 RepID=UPI00343EFA39
MRELGWGRVSCAVNTPALPVAAPSGLGAAAPTPVRQAPDSPSTDGGQIPHTAR